MSEETTIKNSKSQLDFQRNKTETYMLFVPR